jgi:hypothetical protein
MHQKKIGLFRIGREHPKRHQGQINSLVEVL